MANKTKCRTGIHPKKSNLTEIQTISILDESVPAPANHPYLISKCIGPNGVREYKGSLVLPVYDSSGRLHGCQFIDGSGKKRALLDGPNNGYVVPVRLHISPQDDPPNDDEPNDYEPNDDDDIKYSAFEIFLWSSSYCKIIVCDEWATGCSIAEIESDSYILAATNSDDLKAAAIETRKRWPLAEIIIAVDDGQLELSNLGATKARKVAIASSATLASFQWPKRTPSH